MYNLQTPSGFEKMYEDYFSKIYNYVFYRVLHKEQTEDIVSDIFAKVLENLHRYDSQKGSFSTWIFAIARNSLTDYYRRRRVCVSMDVPDTYIEPSIDFEEQCDVIVDEELREMYKALAALDERTRMVISLKYFGEFNNREISRQTGINESTVSTLCCRGLAKLEKILQGSLEVTFEY